METQMDLLSFYEHNPIDNACCVVLDGKCKDIIWQELFDCNKYDTLRCVTYVSSGSFFEKAVSGFEHVEIIIGIEKGDVKRAFDESIRARLQNDGSKLFENLSDEGKEKVVTRVLRVKYSQSDTIIHSKFYLLSNSVSGSTRLIYGSANLTESAFSNNAHQFEDVMAFDDNEQLFSLYEERYEAIKKKTSDFISEDIIRNYKEGKLISVGDFTAEEKTEKLLELLEKENIVPLINDEVFQQAQESMDLQEKEMAEVRASYEVITVATKKSRKSGGYVLKSPKELEASKPRIIDILFKGTKQEFELARFALNYNEPDKKQYQIFLSETGEAGERKAEIYDRQASSEEIKNSIENLNRFIAAYKNFVSAPDPDNENLAHVFETILYAFTSAYIFKFRQETTSSRKTDIPIMLIIGGRASSGKSSLLAYIDALLSGRHLAREDHYYQYEKLSSGKKLENLFLSENTYPLLVDEVAPTFFNSKTAGKGEAFIKYLANTLDGKHPAMICTTNTDTFNIPAQVARRIYYVQVDACFDENCKGQATAYYEEVMNDADNLLFRDFCYQMGEKISHHDDLFGEGDFDYLHCAREIFKDYYRIAEQDIPSFMPQKLYQDYANRGREMWKVLFQQEQASFTYNRVGKTGKPELVVNLKDIANGVKDVNVYMNYLRQDLLVEAAGLYTILRADEFFGWIGVKNPWRKKKFIERLMHRKD